MKKFLKVTASLLMGVSTFALASCDVSQILGSIGIGGVNPPHEHTCSETRIQEPTCEEMGKKEFICECGESYYEEFLDCLGHDFEEHPGQEPTCVNTGWVEYRTCKREGCGYTSYGELEIVPENHTFGADGVCTGCGTVSGEGLEYTLSDDKKYYILTSMGNCTDKELIIPSTHEGLEVRVIGNSAFLNASIKKVVLPETVTTIEDSAFAWNSIECVEIPQSVTTIKGSAFYMSDITSLEIPDSVTEIGDFAFVLCENLTSVAIGSGVTNLSGRMFEGCVNLKSITVSEENPAYKIVDGTMYSKDGKTLVMYVAGKTATSFEIPDDVTKIGDMAFAGCEALTSVTFPQGLESFGYGAFSGCINLESVEIGNNVTKIGDNAFSGCASLTSVVISDSVTEVGSWTFYQCTGLKSLTFGKNVARIGGQTVGGCTALESLIFLTPNGWHVAMTQVSFYNNELLDSAKAIEYMRDTYCQTDWYRLLEE